LGFFFEEGTLDCPLYTSLLDEYTEAACVSGAGMVLERSPRREVDVLIDFLLDKEKKGSGAN